MSVIVMSHTHTKTAILAGELHWQRAGLSTRLRGLLVAGPCWLILLTAWSLAPAANGQGTHEQLGLPPCSILARTGWPCPGCGMTTSIAEMTRGHVGRAWHAHPFGVLLFVLLAVFAIAGGVELITARPVMQKFSPSLRWAWILPVAIFAGWLIKAITGYYRGEYPLK